MKICSDFISNSSSCSFVVLHSENIYGVLLYGELIKQLTLEEYFEKFGERELFEWRWFYDMNENSPKFTYVSDIEFCEPFKQGKHEGVLPLSAKALNEKLCSAVNKRLEHERELSRMHKKEPYSKLQKRIAAEYALEDKITKKVIESLRPEFDGKTFDYLEVEDNWAPELEFFGKDVLSMETLTKNRIQYL